MSLFRCCQSLQFADTSSLCSSNLIVQLPLSLQSSATVTPLRCCSHSAPVLQSLRSAAAVTPLCCYSHSAPLLQSLRSGATVTPLRCCSHSAPLLQPLHSLNLGFNFWVIQPLADLSHPRRHLSQVKNRSPK